MWPGYAGVGAWTVCVGSVVWVLFVIRSHKAPDVLSSSCCSMSQGNAINISLVNTVQVVSNDIMKGTSLSFLACCNSATYV